MLDDEGKLRSKEFGEISVDYKWQGRDKFLDYLKTDDDLVVELEAKIRGQV
jgi:hypothetical protein